MKNTKSKYNTFSREELNLFLEKAQNGDEKAFENLAGIVREIAYSYYISKFNSKKLKSKDDADDLSNEVFLAFSSNFKEVENIENWLRKVMFIQFVKYYNTNKVNRNVQLNEEITSTDEENLLEDQETKKGIARLLEVLPANKKEIIYLRFWEGLKFNEIAEKLNKNEAAIKKMFYRTLDELKNRLE